MTTISVPLNAKLEKAINHLIESGYGSNKIEVIHRAVISASEEEAIGIVLRAKKEISLGRGIKGGLKELVKKFK